MNIETITEQALKLAPASRAYIAKILLESLDYEDDFIVSEEWRQEIQKRCKDIDADPSLLIDGEQFMAELKQRYFRAGSQSPDWEPRRRSSSFAKREAGAFVTEFPSLSLGTSGPRKVR